MKSRRTIHWQQILRRYFADDPGAPEGGEPGGAAGDTPDGTSEPFIAGVFNEDGTFKAGWKDKFKDIIGESKYFDSHKDIKGLLKSAAGLSKVAGRKLLPPDDAPAEAWDEVYSAGVPEKAEDYGLSVEDLEDEGYSAVLKKINYLGRMQSVFKEGGVPIRMAPKMATAFLKDAEASYQTLQTSIKDARAKVEKQFGNKVKWDDAVVQGRQALARLCNHTEESPAEDLQGFYQILDSAGLTDHPYVVSLMHRISQRLMPAKVVAGGGKATGPGVTPGLGYAGRMAPHTLNQVRAMTSQK